MNTSIMIFRVLLSLFYYKVELTPTTINIKQHIKQPHTNKVFLPNLLEMAPHTIEKIVKEILENKASILAVP